jgi:hypothetical protein
MSASTLIRVSACILFAIAFAAIAERGFGQGGVCGSACEQTCKEVDCIQRVHMPGEEPCIFYLGAHMCHPNIGWCIRSGGGPDPCEEDEMGQTKWYKCDDCNPECPVAPSEATGCPHYSECVFQAILVDTDCKGPFSDD